MAKKGFMWPNNRENCKKSSYVVDTGQKEILDHVEEIDTVKALAEKVETSRAMLYRNIKDLADRDFIESPDDRGYRPADYWKVARL